MGIATAPSALWGGGSRHIRTSMECTVFRVSQTVEKAAQGINTLHPHLSTICLHPEAV